MLIKKAPDIRSSEITPESLYLRRREFIQAAGLTAAAAVTGVLGSGRTSEAGQTGEPLTVTKKMLTTGDEAPTPYDDVTTYNNFYEFGTDKDDPARASGRFKPKPWSVRVEGLCNKPGDYNLEDILRPNALEERVYRLRCVEAWSMIVPWVGLPLGDVLKRFEPNGNARYVEFETIVRPSEMPGQQRRVLDWPYREGLRLDEAMNPLAIMAVGLYGRVLPNQNGAPMRLIVPWKYGFKGIKSIVKVKFVDKEPLNTWRQMQASEYGFYANVNPAVDHPRWSQATERRIGEFAKRKTLMFNGYAEQVQSLYSGMDLRANY